MSIGESIIKVKELENTLQICIDNGAKKVFLLQLSVTNLAAVSIELLGELI